MRTAPTPVNEAARLRSLENYDLLDTIPEDDIDSITRIASKICDTPISLVTLVDKDRQWFKSKHGLSVNETPRDASFCAHAICRPEEMMIVEDARQDERFADNPLVTGTLGVTFYGGVPLINHDGHTLGTLCVIDNKPNRLSDEQISSLRALARQVVCQFELRKKLKELADCNRLLEAAYEDMDQFSGMVAHDLRTPCTNVRMLADALIKGLQQHGADSVLIEQAGWLKETGRNLCHMIDSVLKYARTSHVGNEKKESVSLPALISEIARLCAIPENIIVLQSPFPVVRSYLAPLRQILINLIDNARKYNDNLQPRIVISCKAKAQVYHFTVSDNGPGMPDNLGKRAFELFQRGDAKDKELAKGNGIGLATVRRLVQKLNGSIVIEPAGPDGGTTISFTIGR